MGTRKGYKQTADHIAKRIRVGAAHANWKGNDILQRSGRSRAQRRYKSAGVCQLCLERPAERHHLAIGALTHKEGG